MKCYLFIELLLLSSRSLESVLSSTSAPSTIWLPIAPPETAPITAPNNPNGAPIIYRKPRYEASAKVAQSIGITVQPLGVREPDDFNEAFAAMNREPPDAILMVWDSLTTLNRKRVFDFAAERKLPAIYEYDFLVRDGGLMSYGPDLKDPSSAPAIWRRAFSRARGRPICRSSSRPAIQSSSTSAAR